MISLLGKYSKHIAASFFYFMLLNFTGDLKAAINAAEINKGVSGALLYLPIKANPAAVKEKREDLPFILSKKENKNDRQVKQAASIGPTQPEMQSFKSSNADNMVDLFTGDFSYNIPLLDVGGYPVSLHYNSGISMDQEASWVGLGWNVNPGSVSRSMRGLPDDFNGVDSIKRIENIKENRTVSVNGDINIEVFGNSDLVKANIGATLGISYNNYLGWGVETGLSPSISTALNSGKNAAGNLTAALSITSNSMYGVNVSPSLAYQQSKNGDPALGVTIGTTYNNRSGISSLQLETELKQAVTAHKGSVEGSVSTGISSSISFATPSFTPTISMPFENSSFSFTGKLGTELWGVRPGFGITGSVQTQKLAYKERSFPAYGYIFHSKGIKDENSLLDFNREKDLCFNFSTTPHIALPSYTYDAFNITGEGTGGMFRAYRGDIGYIRDHKMQTKSGSDNFSVDIGIGAYFHGGVDIKNMNASTVNSEWTSDNNLLPYLNYTETDSVFESVYFKNPGEQTAQDIGYQAAIGNDSLVRAKIGGTGESIGLENKLEKFSNGRSISTISVSNNIIKKKRDKRTQVINCLTAEEASLYGLDKYIKSYPENIFDTLTKQTSFQVNLGNACLTNVKSIDRQKEYRKAHHISAVEVLNADGKKYVYGIPVYNKEQHDVTFAVTQETRNQYLEKGLTKYDNQDDGTDNSKGKDNYFSENITPAYAHSFLLTGILSPDYVDIRNDGITDDDLGDAIRFNYTQVADSTNPYKWRIPYTQEANIANYNEGFKSYNRDDKASYIYGEKELWYLNNVESKNMVAIFSLSKRYDLLSVNGRMGGFNPASGKMLRRLDRIDLYSKADLIKNGTQAKPIKTVRFEYDYSLCKGINGDGNKGKLTLKKVWFSYNGRKERNNPYIFSYHSENEEIYNKAYNPARYDRWGNYKDPSSNPGALNNYDYPYTEQDSVKAGRNAAVWHLNSIQQPAGSRIKIQYESDDYGYVQNKRAAQLFALAGFGDSPTATPAKEMYTKGAAEKLFAFVDLPVSVANATELKEKYLKGIDTLYFKLFVRMPNTDKWPTGNSYEWVPLYAGITGSGLVPGSTTRAWIQVKAIDGSSPFAKVAIQFLRLNLPSKAYPGSETGSNMSLTTMIKALFTSMGQYANMFKSFESSARSANWAREVALNRSFVRLCNPSIKKLGGGVRVKRVEMWDNWHNMTGGAMKEASYGKEYNYYTTEEVNGVKMDISSGVASYEPAIGNDENPFRIAKELREKTAALAPTNLMFSEEPLGESFFPSSMIGYSKITVRTIHTKAKSANGWDQTEFYTAKDFPVLTEYTPLDETGKKRHKPQIPSFFKVNAKDYVTISQGFKVELNDMHGKMKSEASFPENDFSNPVKYTKYFYRVDNPKASQQHINNDVDIVQSGSGLVETGVIGKEIELMTDFREQTSKMSSANVGVNVDIIPLAIFPLTIGSKIPFPQWETTRFRSSAIVKIVNRHALLDSIVHVDKGSVVSTKNMVWDGESGQVLVSKTNNEFNDPVYNFSYPAYWAYEGMGSAFTNINASFGGKGLKIIRGKLFGPNNEPSAFEKYFKSGDEIFIEAQLPKDSTNIPVCDDPEWETGIGQSNISRKNRIWAIDAGIGNEKDKGTYFIDKEGRGFNGRNFSSFRIIRSGKRNITSAGAGTIISLQNPLRQISGETRIIIDSLTEVLNANTNTYSDIWKVNNHFYIKDTLTTKIIDTTLNLSVKRKLVMMRLERSIGFGLNADYFNEKFTDKPYLLISNTRFEDKSLDYDTRSIIDFDIINQINKVATSVSGYTLQVNNATLTLTGRPPHGIWNSVYNAPGGWRVPWTAPEYLSNSYTLGKSSSSSLNGRDNTFLVVNLRSQWTNSTKFTDDLYGTNIADMVPGRSTGFYPPTTINVLNQVQSALETNQSHGFLLQLAYARTGSSQSSDRTIGFSCEGEYAPVLTVNVKMKKDTTIQLCKLFINDSVVNPYRFGVLGNWRPGKSYVYYSKRDDRMETNLSTVTTNIRKDGTLKGFKPYWNFSAGNILPTADTSQWVWTSAQTIFNKKGFELENYDALNRYNAGLYGYNQQMAIAAAQNAKAREIMFDGLEDYNYTVNNCNELCKDPGLFDGFTITNTDSHTGKHSISLPANQSKSITLPLTNQQDTAASLSIRIDSTENYKRYVNPKGTGLTALYQLMTTGVTLQRKDPQINMNWTVDLTPFPSWNHTDRMDMSWYGKIQTATSDFYSFSFETGKISPHRVYINEQLIQSNSETGVGKIYLVAGQLYDVRIHVTTKKYVANLNKNWESCKLEWKRDGDPASGKQPVPMKNLYPGSNLPSDTSGSIVTNFINYCIALKNVVPHNVLLPKLAPIKGTKVIISTWVKMKNDNNNTMALSATKPIGIGYDGATSSSDYLVPTGVRIEGWQRYELITTIPADAAALKVFFKAGATEFLYDDFRIHPFSSNMKSFVYDPVSLKLVSDLDENNYASFYEYDEEGTLIRVKKETERGIKTIRETQSSLLNIQP